MHSVTDPVSLTIGGVAVLVVAVPLIYAAVARRRLQRRLAFVALASARSLCVALVAGLAIGVWLGLTDWAWRPLPWACWLVATAIFVLECHATARHFGRFR